MQSSCPGQSNEKQNGNINSEQMNSFVNRISRTVSTNPLSTFFDTLGGGDRLFDASTVPRIRSTRSRKTSMGSANIVPTLRFPSGAVVLS